VRNLREIADVLLTARKVAGRIGCTYKLREDVFTGMSVADEARVMESVREIERFTEDRLSSLTAPTQVGAA
jgi:hypothetical protein